MIYVVAPSQHTWEFESYLQKYGTELIDRLRLLTYDEILSRQEAPLGSYIFVALDQLTPTEKEIAVQCCQALSRACPEITLINHPSEVLLRYDLLKACFDRERNTFRVRRAFDFPRCGKFPVFLRGNLDHNGSLTGLLYTRRELTEAIVRSLCRGYRLRDLIVVEYCDTVDRVGMFRKYSAFIVGDRVLPHTLMHSTNWITKSHGRLIDANTADEELAYVRTNPHAEWLRETFDLAKIRYGRIDYGLMDGKPQVWEINTNPAIVRPAVSDPVTEEQRMLRDPVRHHFFSSFQAALEAIDAVGDPGRTVRVEISQGQHRRVEAERRLRLQVKARKTAISQCADLLVRLIRQ